MCECCNSYMELCNALNQGDSHLCRVKILSLLELKEMNTTELKGNWNEQKAKLKQKFAVLTNNDQMLFEGKKEEKVGRFQTSLGRTMEDLQKIILEI